MKLMHDIYYNNGAVKYNLTTNIFAFLNVPMRIRSRNSLFSCAFCQDYLKKKLCFSSWYCRVE